MNFFKAQFIMFSLIGAIILAVFAYLSVPDHLRGASIGKVLSHEESRIWFGLFLLWFVIVHHICMITQMKYGMDYKIRFSVFVCMIKGHSGKLDKENKGWAKCLRCEANWVPSLFPH